MVGTFFLWLAIGEAILFLTVLGFVVIEEAAYERRLKLDEATKAEAAPQPPASIKTEAESVKALLTPITDLAA